MLACVNLLMYGYFITFSDDYSRFGYVYSKFDALDKFIKSKAKSDNLLGKHINILRLDLRLDQGGMSSKFISFHRIMRLYPSCVHRGFHIKME